MSDTVDILKKLALQVRNASIQGENTAERIGRVLIGLLDHLSDADVETLSEYFLRSDKESTAKEIISFLKGIKIGDGNKGIDVNGNANLLSLMLGEFGITSKGVATFINIIANGIQSANFITGALGSGLTLKIDENGDSYFEVDRALFRKSATFIELIIQSLKHVGGQIILTPASMHCIKVDTTATYYRCYFRSADGDKTLYNEFRINDYARCQTFNVKEGVNANVTNQYYWRKVVGVGGDYIDLSISDCDASSTAPQVGDDIVQLGNDTDATRQAALILSAFGNDAPYLKFYRGINGYSLDGKEIVNISRSEVMIIADKFKFSTGENIKDYIDGMIREKWVADTSYNANTILSFCNYLVKSNKTTTAPPFAIMQDSTGKYMTDKDGAYIISCDSTGKAIKSDDWNIIQDNNSIIDEVKIYSKSLFDIASDQIASKVSQDVYTTDKNGITTRLSSAESSIVQQANQIASKVSSTTFDALGNRVTVAESTIVQQASQIALKVTQTEVDAAKTDITNKLLDTGIDIGNKIVKVTANTFLVLDNSGNQMAVFELGTDGIPRLKAQYINADGITAKDVDISGVISATGELRTKLNGRRIIISSETNSIRMLSDNDSVLMEIKFNGSSEPYIELNSVNNNASRTTKTVLWPGTVQVEERVTGSYDYMSRLRANGLILYHGGSVYKSYN